MPPTPAGTDSTAIKVRFSKAQVSMIWPGLNYVICQWLTQEQSGQSATCYPFRILPLAPSFDSGTFSARMMGRIKQLWAKIQSIKSNGGTAILDEFEIRAAIFAARTSVKLERYQIRKAQKRGAGATRHVAGAKQALKKDVRRNKGVVEFLEKELKRANRLFKSVVDPAGFKSQSKEWQSHLKWIEYHLAYFKPIPSPATNVGRLESRRAWLDTLQQMTEKAVVELGYELPEPAKLRDVLLQFLTYSLRGRMGEYNHIFMVRNEDSSFAQLKLFDFVEKRLVLKEAS